MISNFIPELWSDLYQVALKKLLVYGSLVNRDYEGEIQAHGDTVHITSFTDPTVRDYTPESNITVDSISDTSLALLIDQMKYVAFDIDDVIKKQALEGWIEQSAERGAYKILDTIDQYIASLMYTAVHNTANDLGDVTADISDNSAFGGVLVALRTALNKANVPSAGRWVVAPPELTGALLQDNRFISAAQAGQQAGSDAFLNGFVRRVMGFDVYESNNVPQVSTGIFNVIAGHGMATTFADQLVEAKTQERELRFGSLFKSLHVFGAKVIRPEALAMANVTVQA